jgi:hypothetical protein
MVDGVYATEQMPDTKMQEDGEKVPAPLVAHVTVPDGDLPVTVAMHIVGEPMGTDEGEQLTEVAMAGVTLPKDVLGMTPPGG